MINTAFLDIKAHIFEKLKKVPGILHKDRIEEEIFNTKTVISSVGYDLFSQIIASKKLHSLLESDWDRMKRELEMHFDVEMNAGILIQGTDQQGRDTTWWTGLEKQRNKKYYWERYKNYVEEFLPKDVTHTLDDDTDVVMDNIENPLISDFSIYGMVVGHVQSGKTGNYAGLVCKAADAGYKFIVVITGGTNNLRNQTQERLNEAFVGHSNAVQVGVGKGNTNLNNTPYSLTTVERDFNDRDADRSSKNINFETISVPLLLVIKKNTRTLKSVISWLEKTYKNRIANHAMLVIDDESDYASINTKDEDDPTAINTNIRKLLSLFSRSAYVAYTATPYANIFIDHEAENENLGRDLFPKDFIFALNAPTNYFGARKVFIDTNKRHLIEIDDYESYLPAKHKKNHEPLSLPESLLEAVRVFIINVAIRNLRGQTKSHNSMLIHGSLYTDVHKRISVLIAEYTDKIKADIVAFGKLQNSKDQSFNIVDLSKSHDKYFDTSEFNFSLILDTLVQLIPTILIREVHQKTTIPLEYRKDIATNAIVIGGTSLARGYTLEGLSVSYFLRSTIFYDTLMQMGRWFGYRPGYEDLCKIYMAKEKMEDFKEIIETTEDLMADFKVMKANKRTPNDFGLAIKEHPGSALQITARNKQKNITEYYHSMRLDGKAKETSVLSSKAIDVSNNLAAISKLISQLPRNKSNDTNGKLWRDIDRLIILDFLNNFVTFSADPLGISARMPINFIKKFIEERETSWDIALYSGDEEVYDLGNNISIKKERRAMTNKSNGEFEFGGRQVSSGNSEAISLEGDFPKNISRVKARAIMSRPLLMLHIVKPTFDKNRPANVPSALAAFGASFPGDSCSKLGTQKMLINTVFYNDLLKKLEEERESDD